MLTGKLTVDLDRRYSVPEAAKVLGVCRKSLEKYTREGLIHTQMHGTNRFFYTGREIKRFYDYTI